MFGLVYGSFMINEEDIVFSRWTQVFILTVLMWNKSALMVNQCCWEAPLECETHTTVSVCPSAVSLWEP